MNLISFASVYKKKVSVVKPAGCLDSGWKDIDSFGMLSPKTEHPATGHAFLRKIYLWMNVSKFEWNHRRLLAAENSKWAAWVAQTGHNINNSCQTVLAFQTLIGSIKDCCSQIKQDLFAHIFQSSPAIAYQRQNILFDRVALA